MQARATSAVLDKDEHIPAAASYKFERHVARSTANTLGPLFVLAYFLFIVYEYLSRPAVNGVAPERPLDAKAVFFFWVLISIFILDWAKSAIAGFEAAALMKSRLAPRSAIHLMWHLERDWGSIAGWYRCTKYTIKYWFGEEGRKKNAHWDGPGLLWFYLALSSVLFFIAVPLLGLTMDTEDVIHLAKHKVIVIGPNQTTFDVRTSPEIADLARNTWRQGLTTAPIYPTIFYAPSDVPYDVSDTFYDDLIREVYAVDKANKPATNRRITFFSSPRVAGRVHGSAWGLHVVISCAPVNIYSGLKLIKVSSKSNWSTPDLKSSTFEFLPILNGSSSYNALGFGPSIFFNDSSFGISFEYELAISDSAVSELTGPQAEYNNASTQPIEGAFEIAMWQSLLPGYSGDETLEEMSRSPLVVSSEGALGYGVRCEVSSQTGLAELNAAKRTFSHFNASRSELPGIENGAALTTGNIIEFPGLLSIQWLAFTAITKIIPGFMSAPACLPRSIAPSFDPACSLFYSANLATGGVPYLANLKTSYGPEPILRQDIIDPARMTLAAYQLFGQTAAAMMAQGPGNFTTSRLRGVEETPDLIAGPVPWQIVLALLVVWATITVLPQFWTFAEKRWSGTLDAFEMFRFGAEYRDAVQRFESNEAWENKVLRQLPGMVGDLERKRPKGFMGLSWQPADSGKQYVNNRTEAKLMSTP